MDKTLKASTVITHPKHIGKRYAKCLAAYTANNILQQNQKLYLHVTHTNARAIYLYEKLGFIVRRKIGFRNLVK